jgi:hypothetical protein
MTTNTQYQSASPGYDRRLSTGHTLAVVGSVVVIWVAGGALLIESLMNMWAGYDCVYHNLPESVCHQPDTWVVAGIPALTGIIVPIVCTALAYPLRRAWWWPVAFIALTGEIVVGVVAYQLAIAGPHAS